MTQKILVLVTCFFTFSAWAGADRDVNLDEVPAQNRQDIEINNKINIDVLNSTPSVQIPNIQQTQTPVPNTKSYNNGGQLPPRGSIVPITIEAHGSLVRSPGGWNLLTNIMAAAQYELAAQGYNNNLSYYKVQRLFLDANAGYRSGAQVALIQNARPISSINVAPSNNVLTYDLYNSTPMQALDWPLSLVFTGRMRVQSVTLFLTPKIMSGRTPIYPPRRPGNYPGGNYGHHNNNQVCNGRDTVQIGEEMKMHKDAFHSGTDKGVFSNYDRNRRDIIYSRCRNLIVSVSHSDLKLTKVEVQYIDRYGRKDNYLLNRSSLQVKENDRAYFRLPFNMRIISVTLRGETTAITGNRARVRVGLR